MVAIAGRHTPWVETNLLLTISSTYLFLHLHSLCVCTIVCTRITLRKTKRKYNIYIYIYCNNIYCNNIRVSLDVLGIIDVTGVQGGAPPRNADLRGDRSRPDLCRCGHSRSMWGPQHPLQAWRYLQCRCLHLPSLYRRQISA